MRTVIWTVDGVRQEVQLLSYEQARQLQRDLSKKGHCSILI